MIIADLQGKLSSQLEEMEDILTSNVFSFFKYSDRTTYLKKLLHSAPINIQVSDKDLEHADFIFWPRYEDGTEPDVVILIGKYYLLFEMKFHSGFGEANVGTEAQLIREIKGGMKEAKRLGKIFRLIAVTADYCYPAYKFTCIPPDNQRKHFKWTNWQNMACILHDLLNSEGQQLNDYFYAKDLYELLDKKALIPFMGYKKTDLKIISYSRKPIFFSRNTSDYRGEFIGFQEALLGIADIDSTMNRTFFEIEEQ